MKKALELTKITEKKYPDSSKVLLQYAQLYMYNEEYDRLQPIIKKMRLNGVEGSKLYYAKFLEFRGIYSIFKNNVEKGTKYLKKALKINNSTELRMKLAALELTEYQEANTIIVESKAIKLINSSKNFLKENSFKLAFRDALEATRVAPDYIKAKLHLNELQITQGFYKEAITSLEKLYDKFPQDKYIIFFTFKRLYKRL